MIGFGAGYYLGAKAGRERYEQLDAMIKKVRGSDAYEVATDKARDVVDLTVEKTKGFIDEHKPGASADVYDGDLSPITNN